MRGTQLRICNPCRSADGRSNATAAVLPTVSQPLCRVSQTASSPLAAPQPMPVAESAAHKWAVRLCSMSRGAPVFSSPDPVAASCRRRAARWRRCSRRRSAFERRGIGRRRPTSIGTSPAPIASGGVWKTKTPPLAKQRVLPQTSSHCGLRMFLQRKFHIWCPPCHHSPLASCMHQSHQLSKQGTKLHLYSIPERVSARSSIGNTHEVVGE